MLIHNHLSIRDARMKTPTLHSSSSILPFLSYSPPALLSSVTPPCVCFPSLFSLHTAGPLAVPATVRQREEEERREGDMERRGEEEEVQKTKERERGTMRKEEEEEQQRLWRDEDGEGDSKEGK